MNGVEIEQLVLNSNTCNNLTICKKIKIKIICVK